MWIHFFFLVALNNRSYHDFVSPKTHALCRHCWPFTISSLQSEFYFIIFSIGKLVMIIMCFFMFLRFDSTLFGYRFFNRLSRRKDVCHTNDRYLVCFFFFFTLDPASIPLLSNFVWFHTILLHTDKATRSTTQSGFFFWSLLKERN